MPPRRVEQLPAGFGRVSDAERERDRYTQHLLSSLPASRLTARTASRVRHWPG